MTALSSGTHDILRVLYTDRFNPSIKVLIGSKERQIHHYLIQIYMQSVICLHDVALPHPNHTKPSIELSDIMEISKLRAVFKKFF